MTMKVLRFDVDEAWAKQNNELLRDTRRLQWSSAIFGLVCLAAGLAVYFFASNESIRVLALAAGIAALVVCCVITCVVPRQVGTASQLYKRYPLAPAIIAKINPRDVILLALVNTAVDPSAKPRWGLATRTVTAVKGHERKVGTKIPVAAVGGRRATRGTEVWQEITPMPIAWGTPDPEVLDAALNAIPTEQWELLRRHRKMAEKVQRTRFNLYVLEEEEAFS